MSFSEPCNAAWGRMSISEREALLRALASVGVALTGKQPSWSGRERQIARISRYDDLPAGLQGELIIAFDGMTFTPAKYRDGLPKVL